MTLSSTLLSLSLFLPSFFPLSHFILTDQTVAMNPRLRDMALAKLERPTITIGDNLYLLHTLFSEKSYHEMAERQAVFFAQRALDSQPAVIKLRIQYVFLYEF